MGILLLVKQYLYIEGSCLRYIGDKIKQLSLLFSCLNVYFAGIFDTLIEIQISLNSEIRGPIGNKSGTFDVIVWLQTGVKQFPDSVPTKFTNIWPISCILMA